MKHFLIIFLLSILAIFAHGYQFGISDQEIFIPYIYWWQDSSLFHSDILLEQPQRVASIFYPLVGLLSEFIELELIFFLGFLIFQFFLMLAVYGLTLAIFKNKKIAYLSLPLFLLPKFIGGTATMTFDTFFGHRSVGVIFLIFYLSSLLERQWKKAFILGAAGFIFHPLSIIPAIPLFPVLFAKDMRILPALLKIALPLITLLSILIFLALPKDTAWYEIIKTRDDYLFPSTWSTRAWAAMFLYISLVFVFLNRLAKSVKSQVLLIMIVSLTFFLVNFALLEIAQIPHTAQFQLVRSILPLAYIGLAMASAFLLSGGWILRFFGALSYFFLSINAFSLFLMVFLTFSIGQILTKLPKSLNTMTRYGILVPTVLILSLAANRFTGLVKNKVEFPKSKGDWQDVQLWAKKHTSKDATFLVPPDQTGFRIFSQRPIVADIKDGTVSMYSRVYAVKWRQRIEDLKNYKSKTKEEFEKLRSKYVFDYIITPSFQILDLEKVYSNGAFNIYKI